MELYDFILIVLCSSLLIVCGRLELIAAKLFVYKVIKIYAKNAGI